ncbi:MAG: DUF4159 domain-containing protein [Planctomycetaceae bacterium]|nr:DUF4159 domain-containing protein [Planctomycetaceae bacterium]
MRHNCCYAICLMVWAWLSWTDLSHGAAGCARLPDDLDGEQVRQSIQRGVRFLLNERVDRGYWRENTAYRGGNPALVVLALLNAGVDPNSPELREPIRRLSTEQPLSTYASSLIVMVLAEADPIRYRPQIRLHVDFLISKQEGGGGFGYGHANVGAPDSSNSQFAVLALHEAQIAGVDIDRQVWQRAQKYWEGVFVEGTGCFEYRANAGNQTGSMTCAGVCSAFLIAENLHPGASIVQGNQVTCCQTPPENKLVNGGLKWLGRNFSVANNPTIPRNDGHSGALYYYLYSLERTGRITGRRFIGSHDWYREGTKSLLEKQNLKGSWTNQASYGETDPLVTTSMALLFLSKGLRPILIGKYQHGEENSWDPHPQGVHFLTRYVEKAWTRKLNWQTIEASHATADDLMEAPVLHITGDRRLKLTFEQIANLKKYVDNGGFLLIEAQNGFDCPSARLFDQDVRELLSVIYPDTKLEVLKPEHPVWNSHFPLKPDQDFPLLGIQSCCRTSVIYCAGPISGFWELNRPKQQEYGDAVRQKITYSVQLGTNILAFATGNELKDKLDRPKLDNEQLVKNVVGRRILVPKLRHQSGFDDAPMALSNLLRRVNTDRGVQFTTQAEFVDANLESLLDFPIVFVHGRGKFSLSDKEREALSIHIQRGGFVFGDAICGDKSFAESFREEMQKLIPEATWDALDKSDHVFSDRYGGYDIQQVQMRLPDAPGGQAAGYVPTDPKLEALKVGDRYRVIFSPYDISCALESGTSSSCYGYSVEDAARIAANVMLYSLQP